MSFLYDPLSQFALNLSLARRICKAPANDVGISVGTIISMDDGMIYSITSPSACDIMEAIRRKEAMIFANGIREGVDL